MKKWKVTRIHTYVFEVEAETKKEAENEYYLKAADEIKITIQEIKEPVVYYKFPYRVPNWGTGQTCAAYHSESGYYWTACGTGTHESQIKPRDSHRNVTCPYCKRELKQK